VKFTSQTVEEFPGRCVIETQGPVMESS
jgi:hypothetical protein